MAANFSHSGLNQIYPRCLALFNYMTPITGCKLPENTASMDNNTRCSNWCGNGLLISSHFICHVEGTAYDDERNNRVWRMQHKIN